ncbi:type II toxin-antitoxin system VapC family toxin [Aeromicrobium sp.]|uniref:type II toxin-antitoxin system VapC family toxin n=1 Tax=Aeromicrobium sp. TaxID=1871063 RepID=UPI003D6B4BAB
MTNHQIALVDTSALIMLATLDPESIPQDLRISAVSLAELSVGPLVAATDSERAERQTRLQVIEALFDPLPFDAAAARTFGRVAAAFRARGRKASARTYDAMIAATALTHGLPLVTANAKDFEGIDGLEIIAV